ncbi:uncharacterized protein BKA55DRAFT_587304 [Fusarium redolens]|uniref:C2H2-type domain-containing protein n=1 Tax=Fusarium redolens TaxID=48865 RepID=A0A9P9JJZ5_FUSRE|nr:uncharacterized protein BKA55DRAFT_587304 [Fusarium redolens]KAH7205115.1 hypothetical protein BKA55DRAFT_587304 [Fusarium redolens]
MVGPRDRFECQERNCSRSYLRKEHLVRHQKDHTDFRPFQCHLCTATFNRKDLCNRHIALSHKVPKSEPDTAGRQERPLASSDDAINSTRTNGNQVVQAMFTTSCVTQSLRSEESLAIKTRPEHIVCIDQTLGSENMELIELYFCRIHPHWPLLGHRIFVSTPQPERLVRSVLVAGLWVKQHPNTREMAQLQYDVLLQDLSKTLFNYQKQSHDCAHVSSDQLPMFQALIIPLILATYRGSEAFGALTMNTKFLFGLFDRAGLFSQNKIDEQCSSPVVREQYLFIAY